VVPSFLSISLLPLYTTANPSDSRLDPTEFIIKIFFFFKKYICIIAIVNNTKSHGQQRRLSELKLSGPPDLDIDGLPAGFFFFFFLFYFF
jgi:hypothetical protein